MKDCLRFPLFCSALIMIGLTLSSCSREVESTAQNKLPEHPRLILSGDFLESTRQRCQTSHATLFAELKESVDRYLDSPPDSLPVRHAARLAEKCAFIYLIDREQRYLEKAFQLLPRALERYVQLEREQGGGYWEAVEFRRYCCFTYDWLFSAMSSEQRKNFGEKIIQAGRIAWEKQWFTPYGGGGYGTLDPVFWPAVTMAGTGVQDSLAGEWFDWTERNIREWRKMHGQVAADDGGMYSGLGYAAYNYLRTPIFDLEIWKSLTGEDLTKNNPYLRYFSIWWLYCLKPNREWPRIDDAGSVKGSIQSWHFNYLASRYRDPVSQWYLENLAEPSPITVWDVIWNPADLDIEPAGPDSTWPLARHFEGIGWVVMRSGWDSSATHAIFDCGDFYYGHQHPAENAFTIFKKGSLAINSGRYEWGSNHRPNYMARTIASNTILVYDPNERFTTSGGELLSNDGGQRWPIRSRESFGPAKGTGWDTGDIIAFETNRLYSYVCGDATKAYNPNKLKLFTRQFIHIQPDLFIIFDRVEATEPGFEKFWIMHSVNEPVIKGHLAEVSEREGKLYVQTVFPEDAVMRKVGGPGHEFEIFGKNYPPALTHYELRKGEEWGSWRIEVTPGNPQDYDCFLHLLLAGDRLSSLPPEFESLGSMSSGPGVRVPHQGKIYEVLFNPTGVPGGRIRILGEDETPIIEKPLTEEVQPQAGIGN